MELKHGRVSLRLHELSAARASGQSPLLLLHELGSSAAAWSDEWRSWQGPVYALDFSGHGESDHAIGRSYYPEFFVMDADLALEAIGDEAHLAGAGIGAYVAMLLAGSRPDRIPAALLLPGRGLASGGEAPDFDRGQSGVSSWQARLDAAAREFPNATDPFVATCEGDLRPLDYVSDFAKGARRLLFSDAVAPEDSDAGSLAWWRSAMQSPSAHSAPADLGAALRALAG